MKKYNKKNCKSDALKKQETEIVTHRLLKIFFKDRT